MFERINRLVLKHGFTLKIWDDRYSKGVWAVCTQNLRDVRRDNSTQYGGTDGRFQALPVTFQERMARPSPVAN